MRRSSPAVIALVLSLLALTSVVAADPPVPEHNARTLTSPAPRPPVGDADAKARRLFEAIRTDATTSMDDFFLPRDAFRLIKAIANPDQRHAVLLRAFHEDIHELHTSLRGLDTAVFERFDLIRRGGWVPVGEEGNRLPYWASRHSTISYRTGGRLVRFEVRVLITWDDHWYVTHLNEFH